MSLLGFQLYIVLIILMGMVTVHPFPIRRKARTTSSTADPRSRVAVEISRQTVLHLTSISQESTSLHSLWEKANWLAKEDVLKTKVSAYIGTHAYMSM